MEIAFEQLMKMSEISSPFPCPAHRGQGEKLKCQGPGSTWAWFSICDLNQQVSSMAFSFTYCPTCSSCGCLSTAPSLSSASS